MLRRTFINLFTCSPFGVIFGFSDESSKEEKQINGKSYFDIIQTIQNKEKITELDLIIVDALVEDIILTNNESMSVYFNSKIMINTNIHLEKRKLWLIRLRNLILEYFNHIDNMFGVTPEKQLALEFEAMNTYLYYDLLA